MLPIACGTAAGMVNAVIGHPFDTAKTRMQASAVPYRSALHCLQQTVRYEGVLALYKGLAPSLLTTCFTSGLRFGVQHVVNSRIVDALSTAGSSSPQVFGTLQTVSIITLPPCS